MTRPVPPPAPATHNLFDYQVYEGILFGGCGPLMAGPVASTGTPINPVEDPHAKGCCGGSNPACRGCDRCGPGVKG